MPGTKHKRFNRCPKALLISKGLQNNKNSSYEGSTVSPTPIHDQLSDGAWWRHEAPSVAEMMEEAWKSGRQVCRLLLAMDR